MVYFLIPDDDGNLWAGTAQGLIKITLDSESNPISLKLYGIEEGFRGPECNLNSAFKDKDGKLWFGNIAGITVYKGTKGHGKRGPQKERDIIHTVINRIDIRKTYNLIESVDENAFIIEFDVNSIKGGILRKYLTRG